MMSDTLGLSKKQRLHCRVFLHVAERSIDLLPIFLKPAILSSKDKANNDLQALAPRILDVLRSLNIQCKVIRDSAKNTWMYPYSGKAC